MPRPLPIQGNSPTGRIMRSVGRTAVSPLAAVPKGASLVEDSRGKNPELEAKILGSIYRDATLREVDIRIGEHIRKGKVHVPLCYNQQ